MLFDPLYGEGLVCSTITRKRFMQLLTNLRFDDKATRSAQRARDVFAPFRDFWEDCRCAFRNGTFLDHLSALMSSWYHSADVAQSCSTCHLNQIAMAWRYFGLQMQSNFPLVAEPCLGRPLGQERHVNLGRNTAIKLATLFFKTGRNVTTGNFFTDKDLANTLMSNGLTFVGTVRTNKRFLPEVFKVKKGQQLHESSFVFQEKLTLVNYQSKPDKNVVVMSSMHHDKRIDPLAYKRKPDIVRFHNATKGAVDAMDKMAHVFAAKRVTKRWPMDLFSTWPTSVPLLHV